MANKYLDNDGVLYLWGKIKALVTGAVPTKTSDLTNDSGFITSADVPEGATASTSTPLMDGTAAVGSSTAFARGDHVHPTDTSRADGDMVVYVGSISNFDAQNMPLVVTMVENDLTEATEAASTDFDVYTVRGADAQFVAKQTGKGLSTNDYTTAEKNKLAAFASASNYALKSDISNAYIYKGSVATVSALPSSGQTTGDVYNVEASGMNYAWNGTAWDALGEIFTITAITNAELDTICT